MACMHHSQMEWHHKHEPRFTHTVGEARDRRNLVGREQSVASQFEKMSYSNMYAYSYNT